MKKNQWLMLLVCLLFVMPLQAKEKDNPLISVNQMTMDTGLTIARAAIEACRKRGIQIGVTVIDRNGIVQAVLRDTIAPPITIPISRKKAFTSVNFNKATSQLSALAKTPIGRVEGLIMSAGGLPIYVEGQLVGGVGVSGAASGDVDEACAQAGIDKVQDDLEMAL